MILRNSNLNPLIDARILKQCCLRFKFGRNMKTSTMLLSLIFLAGCVSPAHLTGEDSQRIVETARHLALKQSELSRNDRSEIKNSDPKLSYYFLSRPLAEYSIAWNLESARKITISGTGDIFTLAGSKTSITKR
jgi:hypothetical protein